MTMRRAILAVLLAAALPAAAGDVRAWLRPPTVSGDTVVERALRSPKIAGIWDAARGLGYDGTNVATWTDAAFGNVGTATGALQRAYFEAGTFGGYGAVVFSGAQSRPARGAWIETGLRLAENQRLQSRAPRGARGLKLMLILRERGPDHVAPRAGRVD